MIRLASVLYASVSRTLPFARRRRHWRLRFQRFGGIDACLALLHQLQLRHGGGRLFGRRRHVRPIAELGVIRIGRTSVRIRRRVLRRRIRIGRVIVENAGRAGAAER